MCFLTPVERQQSSFSDKSTQSDHCSPREDDKNSFFNELDGLNQSSDEEEDTNELRDILCTKSSSLPSFISSSFSLPPYPPIINTTRIVGVAKKVPSLQRTTSAPTQITTIAETPNLLRRTSLLRYDISAEVTPNTSFVSEVPQNEQTTGTRPVTERRTVSTPTIGSVYMSNSAGIANMLKSNIHKESAKVSKGAKGTKRKSSALEVIPQSEQIFLDKIFYYIPDDDIAALRRLRINKARTYGATWTKQWTPSITHIIVDSGLTFRQIAKWLEEQRGVLEIPPHIILVKDNYPLECIQWRRLLDPTQIAYKVHGRESPIPEEVLDQQASHDSNRSPPLKAKRLRTKDGRPTTASSAESPSTSLDANKQDHYTSNLVESPRECTPERIAGFRSFGDALDEVIKDAMRMPNLDDDEESAFGEASSQQDDEETDNEGERHNKAAKLKKRKITKGTFNQSTFSCMKGGTGLALDSNPNKRTIELLQAMADYYDRIKDQWRTLSYRKAIGTLKRQSMHISTYEEAIVLDNVGQRLAKKIEEIVRTDRLQKLDYTMAQPEDMILQMFMKIYGAGVVQAEKWVKAGYKTLADLVEHDVLTVNQTIGVEHYKDFNTRIPRAEVTALGAIVKSAAAAIDPAVEVIIGGSYRRGAASSGDIDCLITKPGTRASSDLIPFLKDLVTNLTDSRFLVAALAVPGNREDSGSKWHGACVLPSSEEEIWRRIDFLLVPATEFGAALIYFTGNDIFNRSMRLLASKKQMRLNQRGLYKDVMRGPGREKITEGVLVEGADERKIFEILGVPWREPEDRIPN